MKNFIKWLAVVFVSLILWLVWVWHRTGNLEKAYALVQRSDSEARVVEVFGLPTYVTTELETNINWDGDWLDKTNGARCIRQFHYCPPFSICAESWIVGFDMHSNVVSKYQIVSP